jgi:aerobic-type carbon monoxide dehydrogenase small subunit (CoxS/CutS family)
MSLLTHACACGHYEFFHAVRGEGVDCSHGGCRCQRVEVDSTPELIPTFDWAGHAVETITKPGARWGNGLVACNFEECQASYAAQVGGAA